MHGSINGAVASGRCWYAVYTAPKCEHRVQTGLACAGFGAWFPHETRVKVKHGRRVKIRRPVFARYVFAAFNEALDDWRGEIEGIDGALYVLENRDRPVRIPSDAIASLQREELNGAFDRDKLPAPNDELRVATGPFMGVIGRVLSARASGRVKLLLKLLNGMVPVEFPLAEVERIG